MPMRRNRLGRLGGRLNNSIGTKQRGTRCDHVILAPGESVTELLLILVIEDEYFAMRDVEAALADGGFATEAVFSGEEALLFMGSVKNYSALVTDVGLGGNLIGWDVAKRISEKEPAFPVIYVTAHGADQWASHGVPNTSSYRSPSRQRS
jgi:CheY-like chemotaxis protein